MNNIKYTISNCVYHDVRLVVSNSMDVNFSIRKNPILRMDVEFSLFISEVKVVIHKDLKR